MISAIIPAYNEAERIACTVAGLLSTRAVDEIIVVDDGSQDDTSLRADEAGATVIRHDSNRGKGAAMNTGANAAQGDILLLLDADLGECSAQAKALLEPVLSGEADMSIASFPVIPGKGGGMGLVVKFARWGIRRAAGMTVSTPLSGQRAMRRAIWREIGGFEEGFGAEVALTIDTINLGYRIVEVPTTMTHRVTGRDWSAKKHRAKQLAAVAKALWKRRGRHL
jgi:glycosyltransferase involved in cell wall biosynthesis